MALWFDRLRGRGHGAAPEQKAQGTGFITLMRQQSAKWSGRNFAAHAKLGMMANPIAYRAVRLIAESVSRVPLELVQQDKKLADHPALTLLKRPNGETSWPDFVEELTTYLMLAGSAYVEVVRVDDHAQLFVLRPDRVTPLIGKDGWVNGYLYEVDGHKRKIKLEGAQGRTVLHLKQLHPLSDHGGLPPAAAAMQAIETHNTACDWHKALLDNAARPSGALVYSAQNGNLSDEQFARLKSELADGFQGAANAGRPMVLEGGLDWKSIGYSPRDMDFLAAKDSAARDIATAFGVPPMMLCLPGDNTHANYREANRAFWRQTIIPLLTRLCAAMGPCLSEHFQEPFEIIPDFDSVEAIANERMARWTQIDGLNALTDQEKRELMGFRPQKHEGEDNE
ncbi:HK97 family phage portal protein [Maritalea mobilis]|uniref:HK97 family phage portal protein n=1 Tax=Maritalea mobilis TaxID=483324 RepID=A0A4R6VNQ2_9HYPH|nr:phage portal protein [Maritalea mobilis]TDQ63830.1 HK97 family phage portal protein [Maritalea mobilis]